MDDFTSAIPAQSFPVSHALLAHDGLMTPRLTELFGAVHAEQTGMSDETDRILRWSTLYQTVSGAALLQAKLVIHKSALPSGFKERLFASNRLFGSLVIEAGLKVRITDQNIFWSRSKAPGNSMTWGRRHRMLRVGDDAPLCDVEEHLQDENLLQNLVLPRLRDRFVRQRD